MKLLITLILFLSCLACKAETQDEELVHFTAHFGASYALSMVSYGIARKGLGLEPLPAFLVAAGTALAIGAIYKFAVDNTPTNTSFGSDFGKSMMYNSAGVLGAGLTVKVFDF